MLIGYGRVSTLDQSTLLQEDALRAAGCERLYIETASGMKERPQLAAALDYMREGDTLVVWKLDRLGRNAKDLLDTAERIRKNGMHLRILTLDLDTSTTMGKVMFTISAAFAEMEWNLIQERTTAGLAAARAAGRVGGKKKSMTPRDVKAARAMLQTHSPAEIAAKFGVGLSTLYRYIPRAKTVALEDAQAAAVPAD